ncbi:hypothetical protein EV359DRAFT_62013 [Lentinula novae-zelandiae]|nr:hypothetical protein EV359DRAFT_62013 [Lentinula novae-zelandiae]
MTPTQTKLGQVYYFLAFSTAFGWPVLISGAGGIPLMLRKIYARTFGSKLIHRPFLLLDNHHYMFHWLAPYALGPAYFVCALAWFLHVGTLLHKAHGNECILHYNNFSPHSYIVPVIFAICHEQAAPDGDWRASSWWQKPSHPQRDLALKTPLNICFWKI